MLVLFPKCLHKNSRAVLRRAGSVAISETWLAEAEKHLWFGFCLLTQLSSTIPAFCTWKGFLGSNSLSLYLCILSFLHSCCFPPNYILLAFSSPPKLRSMSRLSIPPDIIYSFTCQHVSFILLLSPNGRRDAFHRHSDRFPSHRRGDLPQPWRQPDLAHCQARLQVVQRWFPHQAFTLGLFPWGCTRGLKSTLGWANKSSLENPSKNLAVF